MHNSQYTSVSAHSHIITLFADKWVLRLKNKIKFQQEVHNLTFCV